MKDPALYKATKEAISDVYKRQYKDIASGKKYLSVREWTGRPYNSEQREFAQYEKIGLQHITTVSYTHLTKDRAYQCRYSTSKGFYPRGAKRGSNDSIRPNLH